MEYFCSFSDPKYIRERDLHDKIRRETLSTLLHRTDAMIEAADHLLLLNSEVQHMCDNLRSLDAYCDKVLRIRDYEEEDGNAAWWMRNVGDMDFWEKEICSRLAEDAKPVTATELDIAGAKTLARSLWEEAPLLVDEHTAAKEKWRAERRKHEYTVENILDNRGENTISGDISHKYAIVEWSDKVARKLEILAPGERHDMKVWMNELEASLKESKKQKLRDMGTSCQLSKRMLSAIWEGKKDYRTYQWWMYWRTGVLELTETPHGWVARKIFDKF